MLQPTIKGISTYAHLLANLGSSIIGLMVHHYRHTNSISGLLGYTLLVSCSGANHLLVLLGIYFRHTTMVLWALNRGFKGIVERRAAERTTNDGNPP